METDFALKLNEAEGLLKKLDKLDQFSLKYGFLPPQEATRLVESMQALSESIPEIASPQSLDELIESELKRRIHGEAGYLEQQISGRPYDFDTVINIFSIPEEDIASLRPWLEANKTKTEVAIERLFHSRDFEGFELEISSDIPQVRKKVEEFAGENIQRYHRIIGEFLESLTRAGAFLRDINAFPTTLNRSYFNRPNNTLALSIPSFCFSKEDGTFHINEKALIKNYGHEGMGHALNYLFTNSDSLPFFLTHKSNLNSSTRESVAQFYERRLLEDLKDSKDTQKRLGIESKFDEIYTESKDTEQLEEYSRKIIAYATCVLGNKSLGDYNDPSVLKNKIELVNQVAIDKARISLWMQQKKYNFDSEGNLDPYLVSELRYCANPVARAIEEFKKRGIEYNGNKRTLIDTTMLRGLWTPIGFVDNAKIVAEENKYPK